MVGAVLEDECANVLLADRLALGDESGHILFKPFPCKQSLNSMISGLLSRMATNGTSMKCINNLCLHSRICPHPNPAMISDQSLVQTVPLSIRTMHS